MINTVIFDCFGVLVMSGRDKLYHDFQQHEVELHDLSMQSDYGMITREEYDKAVAELTGLSVDTLEAKYWQNHTLNDSALAWVRELKSNGNYKIGMLSNIGRGWLEDFISKELQHELFDEVVLSGEVNMIKPDPHLFRLAADNLESDTIECVMIDDIEGNVDGAKRVGMEGIIFRSTPQAKEAFDSLVKGSN
jgi:HAD superfamily hydrolase (TIGR01509 family)